MNKKSKYFILKSLLTCILFSSNPVNILAGTISQNTATEIFKGNKITVNDILEEEAVDIEIEGNTLLNLHKKQKYYFWCEEKDYGKYEEVNSNNEITVTFTEQITGWKYLELGKLNLNLIKPNTTYTIYFEEAQGLEWISFCQGNFSEHLGTSVKFYLENNKATVTTTDFIRENVSSSVMLYGYTNADVGTTTKVSNAMIFEGDLEYEYLNYFEKMKSVGQSSINEHALNIKSNGKNIFNVDVDTSKKILMEDGRESVNESWLLYDEFFPVDENVDITISEKRENNIYFQYKIAFYDKDKNFIKLESIGNHSGFATIITPKFTKYYKLAHSTAVHSEPVNREEIMIELGNKKSTYVSYNSDIKSIVLNEPLRSLSNGVKDRIIKRNGQWVVERRTASITYDGSDDEKWYLNGDYSKFGEIALIEGPLHWVDSDSFFINGNITINNKKNTIGFRATHCHGEYYGIRIKPYYKDDMTLTELKTYLKNNPVTVIYQLPDITYEPLNTASCLNLYKELTNISTDSFIPVNLVVSINRIPNRAQESIELAKINPTTENLSIARMWINLMQDSILKDQFNEEVNNIVKIEGLELEKKKVSTNLDVYIKSQNTLSLSLDTNSVTFDNYSGVEDMELLSAVNLTVNSSLPYSLNAYMEEGFYNSDKSNSLEVNSLNIRENTESTYKQFTSIKEKVVLKDNCDEGNEKYHTIDLKLNGNNAHKTDVYKTVVKFEIEQK